MRSKLVVCFSEHICCLVLGLFANFLSLLHCVLSLNFVVLSRYSASSSTANKGTEKKLSELQSVREKAESDLHEKVRHLEKELENSNTRLADFKRRGNEHKTPVFVLG